MTDVEDGIHEWLERWERWGVGFCFVERKADRRVLGRTDFVRRNFETSQTGGDETSLDCVPAREHWGRGYAVEPPTALRNGALSEKWLTRLITLIRPDNVRSIRVAERIGERREGPPSGRRTRSQPAQGAAAVLDMQSGAR